MAGSPNNPAADPALSPRQLASRLLATRSDSAPLNARELLKKFPQLTECKSVVLDLAYEEFCRQADAPSALEPQEFAARFPTIQHSLMRLLEFDQLLQNDSQLYSRFVNLSWPEVGENFLDFQLDEELGRGSFSRVFLARETNLGGRSVVAKVCRRGIEEAKFLGQLDHPHIVPVHSVRTDENTGLTVICMPYLSRATLCDVLNTAIVDGQPQQSGSVVLDAIQQANGDSLPPPRRDRSRLENATYVEAVTRIAWELADGLVFTHGLGICHSDIKPSNVLLSPTGTAMLFDFNLSFDSDTGALSLGGTLPYMAPEQLDLLIKLDSADEQNPVDDPGSVEQALHASGDIYSLGVTLYELLTGKLPFGVRARNESVEQTARDLYEARKAPVPSVREANGQVSRPLSALIEKCLAFAPEDRFSSAAELADELHSLLPKRLRSERSDSPLRTLKHPLTIVAAPAVLAAVAFVASWNPTTKSPPDSAITELQSSLQPSLPEQPTEQTGELDLNTRYRQACADLENGDPDEAYRRLSELAKHVEDHQLRACMAYALCRSSRGRYIDAIEESLRAIELGNDSAAVYNNLGYCYFRVTKLDMATEALQKALARDDSRSEIHANLAMTTLRSSLRAAESAEATELLALGLDQIRNAIAIGPPHPELHLIAARLNTARASRAVAAQEDPTPWEDSTLEHCKLAIQKGATQNQLSAIASLHPSLQQSPRFKALYSQAASEFTADPLARWINPIEAVHPDDLRLTTDVPKSDTTAAR